MTKVRVYWNLHKKMWSVQDRKTGLVIAHTDHIALTDAKFVVRKAGQEKVRREGKKNVHAFAVGTVYPADMYALIGYSSFDVKKVTYNPYKNDTFIFAQTGEPAADVSVISLAMTPEGKPSVLAIENRPTLDTNTNPTN